MLRESPSLHYSHLIAGLILLFAFLSSACTTRVPNATQACQPIAAATPSPNITGTGALLVTDISGSMKGFALPGSVRLFTLHNELERVVRNSLAATEPSPTIKRCWLGINLDCQRQMNLREVDHGETYGADQSRLDLFMMPASSQAKPKGKEAEEDPIDPYRVAVLISDGMSATAPTGASAAPCMAGADPDCIAHLLVQRARQGYGIWMAILLMPFKGNHYAERPLDNSNWQKIQDHVAALSQDEYFQGVKFSVKRVGTSVPFESYQFEGVKPIMVLVLSKDLQLGRSLIQQFTESIKRESIVQPANAVYSVELAPLSIKPRQINKITIPPTAKVEGVRPVTGGRKDGIYDYLIECDRNGVAALSGTSEERPGLQVIPDGVKATFNLVPFEKGTLAANRLSVKPLPDGNFELGLICQQLREGSYETCLNLQANLTIDDQSKAFWMALHADNMYERPERLYGLRSMVQKVLEVVTRDPRVTDRVRFRVERK